MATFPRSAARGSMALGALAVAFVLAGCAPADTSRVQPAAVDEQVLIYPDVSVVEDVTYGPQPHQVLDVCQPSDAEASAVNNGPRRAVISVHGGSWREGDKASLHWRSACEWLAHEGFVTFSVNYRLAPQDPFPAAIEDLRAAVEWLRLPVQASAYGYDPALIGAFGGSAGGNLVSLLGAEGEGPWDAGSRVAAVVELSAPIDLTATGLGLGAITPEFNAFQLEYLGCSAYEACLNARRASPVYAVDPSDPPFFVGHSSDEFIPIGHARSLVDALQQSGVATTFVEAPGDLHSIGLLDDGMRASIVDFLRAAL